MKRRPRLSLRARMLVLLISVTTIFLLIMGLVSATVLSRRLAGQFDQDLVAAAARPQQLPRNPGGYLAEAVPVAAGTITVITPPGQLTTELKRVLADLSLRQFQTLFARQPTTITVGSGEKLRAFAQVVNARRLAGTGIVFPPGRFILVVAIPAGAVSDQVRVVVLAELITGGALIALLAIGGGWLIGRGLEPLEQMASTANEITARGDLTARVPDAGNRTDVGRLGTAINTMLDRIQQAFGARLRSEQKVREFAADASHELRTPLTTIRGYAELYRQGALGPDQLPNAMRRIEQEAQRMSTLVAELLELARLDRTSSLDLTETDLAGVVRDAVADAIAVEPGRPVRAEAPPRLVAVVDEPRIRQVLANLMGNVRAHTPPDTPVAVRLGEVSGGVLIEVADAGPGMSDQDTAKAFDRFHRAAQRPAGRGDNGASASAGRDAADSSNHGGARSDGARGDDGRGSGSGLGLSIVQAIAHAHGGQAVLQSWPGRGTRVRIWLPARAAP
jgi:signal transduction histidine kinase